MSQQITTYQKKSPCNNCPYRTDAPLKLWDKSEYEKLLSQDEQWGAVYGCHKKDGHVCVGWMMKQLENGTPNLNLRLSLMRNKVSREYLDSLHCKSELYESVEQMVEANYPEIKSRIKK